MLQGLQSELNKAGYVVGDNRTGLPGLRMYAGCPGLPDTAVCVDCIVADETITTVNFWTSEPIAVYRSVPEFLAACPRKSEPGLPAFSNSWD